MKGRGQNSSKIEVGFWIIISIISSPTLVLLLKKVSSSITCAHTITVSTFHFLSTWFFLECVAFNGKIRRVYNIPYYKLVLLSLFVVASIVLMNFNLKSNSIGFYQMSKLVCIPYMVFHKMIFKHQKFTAFELFSLTILLIGVALFSVSDIEMNLIGTIFAIAAVLSTVFNQMMTEDLQKSYEVNGQELQLAIAPSEFVIGVIAAIIFEARGEEGFLAAKFSKKSVFQILGTCFFAIGVNLSTFSLIGKTSSVTYQVIGHFKTVLLLVFGYIFFPSKWKSAHQMYKAYTGIVIALFGVFCYTKAKLDIQKARESLPSALQNAK